MITLDDITAATLCALRKAVKDFQCAPYAYLYECDFQAALFSALRRTIGDELIIPGSYPAQFYRLKLVYTKYLRSIDVVCLDPSRASLVSQVPHKGLDTYIYNLPVHIGIEIKYKKIGDRFDFHSCIRDFDKLEALRAEGLVNHGLIVGVLQNESDADQFLAAAGGWHSVPHDNVAVLDCIYIVTENALTCYRRSNLASANRLAEPRLTEKKENDNGVKLE